MERLVFVHNLTEPEYVELLRIMRDREMTEWLSDGRSWTEQKMLDLRGYSARDFALPWSTREYFYWAILHREGAGADEHVVGIIGLHPILPQLVTLTSARLQIMFAVAPRARGKGIAGRAIRAVIDLARANRREDIIAVVRADNVSSLRAIERSRAFKSMFPDSDPFKVHGIAHVVFKLADVSV